MEKGEDIKSVLYLKDGQIKWSRGGSLPGQEMVEVSLYLYTDNGMDVLVTGCAVLLQTMVVVH